MKNLLLLCLLLLSILTHSQTLTGLYILQSKGGVGADTKIPEKAKIPAIYEYKYANNKSNLQLLSQGGVSIDTLKRKLEGYNFDYETIETTKTPSKAIYYKDLKNNNYELIYVLDNTENYIKDKLPKINWDIQNEKKIVNGYECTKALGTRIVMGYTIRTTAWFCDQIPINDGPLDYNGLPGFILELSADEMFEIKFTNLKYNPDVTIDIVPTQSSKKPMTMMDYEKSFN